MKIVKIFSVQLENGYVLKNFGDYNDALNFCLENFSSEKIYCEEYDEKKSMKNFY